jgi:hypothetical protein
MACIRYRFQILRVFYVCVLVCLVCNVYNKIIRDWKVKFCVGILHNVALLHL